jgi:hypothetical protein
MLVNYNLHNLRNLEIKIIQVDHLYSLVDCEEFKMIRHLHIIIYGWNYILKREDDMKPSKIKLLTDVFSAFPDVSFTFEYKSHDISIENAIKFQKKFQNVVFIS